MKQDSSGSSYHTCMSWTRIINYLQGGGEERHEIEDRMVILPNLDVESMRIGRDAYLLTYAVFVMIGFKKRVLNKTPAPH